MAPAGYSGTPVWKKLGFREGFYAALINEPDNYHELIAGLPSDVSFIHDSANPKDLIHFFTKEAKELFFKLPQLKREIRQNGMIWVSWPKKASKVETDVTEDTIRTMALKIGLVDVKVCAIDQTWSALKLVIPVKDRV